MAHPSLYHSSGAYRITIVGGDTWVGTQAADGSLNGFVGSWDALVTYGAGIRLNDGSVSDAAIQFNAAANYGFYWATGTSSINITLAGGAYHAFDATYGHVVNHFSGGGFGFGNPVSAPDTFLRRGAAAVASFDAGSSSVGGTFRAIPLSPAQITVSQNNYAPATKSLFQRLDSSGAVDITGLSLSQVDGQVHTIVNVGANAITLKNQDAASTAANRFLNSTGADIVLSANQAADIFYDGTTARWRVFKKN
jgi:hypothetical protein